MRRNFEIIRDILLAVAEKNVDDSEALKTKLNLDTDLLEYHLKLLCDDAKLIIVSKRGMGTGASFSNIRLTWQGNDFLDAIGDDKAWKKVKKALASGAKIATIEALKQVAKGAGAAGLAIILAERESDVIGIVHNTPANDANEAPK